MVTNKKIDKKEFDYKKQKGPFKSYQIGEHFILCEICDKTREGEANFKYYESGKTLTKKGTCSNCGKEIEEVVSK